MRKWRNDFANPPKSSDDSFYDLVEDYPLIEASFLQQYGIRLRSTEDLSWDEFCTYLIGLNERTPLGKIVAIRAETDPDIIKNMTPDQKRIRREWRSKHIKEMSKEEYDAIMKALSDGVLKAFSK